MTIDEASKCYNIPKEILMEYESWGLCNEVKKVMGNWQYDEQDIERLGLIMTLHDIGFSNKEIESYMKMEMDDNRTREERITMLNKMRNHKLDVIHFQEKQLERLDYLRYKINKMK